MLIVEPHRLAMTRVPLWRESVYCSCKTRPLQQIFRISFISKFAFIAVFDPECLIVVPFWTVDTLGRRVSPLISVLVDSSQTCHACLAVDAVQSGDDLGLQF